MEAEDDTLRCLLDPFLPMDKMNIVRRKALSIIKIHYNAILLFHIIDPTSGYRFSRINNVPPVSRLLNKCEFLQIFDASTSLFDSISTYLLYQHRSIKFIPFRSS